MCSGNHYRSRSLSSPVADQEQTGTKYTRPLAATSERPARVSRFLCLAPKEAGAARFVFHRASSITDPLRLPSQRFTGRTLILRYFHSPARCSLTFGNGRVRSYLPGEKGESCAEKSPGKGDEDVASAAALVCTQLS